MALKALLFVSLLFTAMPLFSLANAEIGGIIGLINIQGVLYCSPNGNVGVNGTATQAFTGAEVQLQCGGKEVTSVTTNNSGVFVMLINPLQYLLSSLLSGCNLLVTTPLASCNVTLPSAGQLISTLQFLGNTLLGTILVANVAPKGFQFIPPN